MKIGDVKKLVLAIFWVMTGQVWLLFSAIVALSGEVIVEAWWIYELGFVILAVACRILIGKVFKEIEKKDHKDVRQVKDNG